MKGIFWCWDTGNIFGNTLFGGSSLFVVVCFENTTHELMNN